MKFSAIRQFIADIDWGELDYLIIDAAPGTPGRKKVVDTGSKSMVPFLMDGEHWMYESDDIIDYLKSKFSS